MRDYRKIRAWQEADEMVVAVYSCTRGFPKEELYGLTSQVRRSAVSVAANIAEGSARESLKDYLHFLYIARASLTETQYLIHLAKRLGYVGGENATELEKLVKSAFVRLHGLVQSVKKEAGIPRALLALLTSGLSLGMARALPYAGSSVT